VGIYISTGNIITTIPGLAGSIFVIFQCHGGGTRTYWYPPGIAEAIEGGADPAGFKGILVKKTK
jgi:hypothetical protein